MAYRLSEDGRYSVIVIEYGVPDVGPLIQMPAALSFPMNMETYDWGFSTEPEPHIGGRSLVTPRGKVLGGSSSINGMVYVRGHARDYDHWSESGARGWAYADVLPYFKRMENSSGGRGAGAAPAARFISSAANATIRCSMPLSRLAMKQALRSRKTIMARSRKALARWNRRSIMVVAGLPPMPI